MTPVTKLTQAGAGAHDSTCVSWRLIAPYATQLSASDFPAIGAP